MQGFLIWEAVAIVAAAICFRRAQAARIFIGLFRNVTGPRIHGALIAANPRSYVDFAGDAPWQTYRDMGTSR